MRRDTAGALEEILEAAGFIAADTAGMTAKEFADDRRTRQLVERNFEIIGEAVNRLIRHAPAVVNRITAYRQIVGLRNALIHGYDLIDYPTLWRTVQDSLPVLVAEIEGLIDEGAGQRTDIQK
jgi:uncharacterized protein with HEPN domain